jgi:PAS domain S-box-containing protein
LMPDVDRSGLSQSGAAQLNHLKKATWSTRQRQTAAAAAATRSRYEELLQSVYDAAVITNPSGRILEVNGRAVEFLRYERATLCSMIFSDVLDGADETLMASIAETLSQERFALLQAYCRRRDGSSFPAEIAVSRLNGERDRFCFFIRDISVRHQTEEMLRTEHVAIQTCGSGIAITDVEGLLAYVNPAFSRMMGSDSEGLLDQDIRTVLGESELMTELMESALNDDQSWMSEVEIINSDGDPLSVQISATRSLGADGEQRGIVYSFADVTVHKQNEAALAAAHAELEARVEARTMDLLNENAKLQEEFDEVKRKLDLAE